MHSPQSAEGGGGGDWGRGAETGAGGRRLGQRDGDRVWGLERRLGVETGAGAETGSDGWRPGLGGGDEAGGGDWGWWAWTGGVAAFKGE